MEEEVYKYWSYSVAGAAWRLGVSRSTIYRWIKERRMSYGIRRKRLKGYYFLEEWLQKYEALVADLEKDDEATKYNTEMKREIEAEKELSTSNSVTRGVA